MKTINEALNDVLACSRPLPAQPLRLCDALGRRLAESVSSDVDSPPFDKSMMDGYAVRSTDLTATNPARLTVVGEVHAGSTFGGELAMREAVRIMTGAPIPTGADAVVRFEDVRDVDASTIEIAAEHKAGTNIIRRAEMMRRGEQLLSPGRRLRPQELALLAEVGRAEVQVHRAPHRCGAGDRRRAGPAGRTAPRGTDSQLE
ncbi:MAG: hypothetical protein R3B90_20515 [Planctomycetaceae bacterium]